jgi:hypothetical protein
LSWFEPLEQSSDRNLGRRQKMEEIVDMAGKLRDRMVLMKALAQILIAKAKYRVSAPKAGDVDRDGQVPQDNT